MTKPILLLDATGILVRSARAAAKMRTLTSRGIPTGDTLLFINTVAGHIRRHDPAVVVACWDKVRTHNPWRRIIWPGYKPGRNYEHGYGDPDALRFCQAAGILSVSSSGFEADDGIAACCRTLRELRDIPGAYGGRFSGPVVIVSDDADLWQLLGSPAIQIPAAGRSMTGRDAAWLIRTAGCTPEQWPLVRAIAGDRSDGIPGVKGFGIKRARLALEQSGWAFSVAARSLPAPYYDLMAWRQIIDLNDAPYKLDNVPGWAERFPAGADWAPDRNSGPVRSFLEDLELESVISRLDKGTLFNQASRRESQEPARRGG
jgi:5'-3' exonuclease